MTTFNEALAELREAFTQLGAAIITEIKNDFNRVKAFVQKKKSK
jgi:hypothetical protein